MTETEKEIDWKLEMIEYYTKTMESVGSKDLKVAESAWVWLNTMLENSANKSYEYCCSLVEQHKKISNDLGFNTMGSSLLFAYYELFRLLAKKI